MALRLVNHPRWRCRVEHSQDGVPEGRRIHAAQLPVAAVAVGRIGAPTLPDALGSVFFADVLPAGNALRDDALVLRQVVESQIIHSVGYAGATRTLEVQFRNGWVYQYDDVPDTVHSELMNAPSHGKYLKRHIVDDYVTRRIR